MAAGHEDRQAPLKSYCKGLLLPGERKSIEPMAARLDPENIQPMRQSLHHLVAKAPWSDAFREITWREGTDRKLQSRFAAVRVRPAHRDYWKAEQERDPRLGAEVGVGCPTRKCLRARANRSNDILHPLATRLKTQRQHYSAFDSRLHVCELVTPILVGLSRQPRQKKRSII